jgi:hypothetical protein
MAVDDGICLAIRARRLLEFDYHGKHRVVVPYCHGTTARGHEALRGVQIGGDTKPGGLGFGKLWIVAEISNLRITATPFTPDDPDYNPDDTALPSIHCRV